MGAGGPFPLCTGAPPGEQRPGYQIARRYSEGSVISRDQFQVRLTQTLQAVDSTTSDASGPGALRLYSIGCVDATATGSSCNRFVLIFSAIFRQAPIPPLPIGAGREVWAFFAEAPASPTGSATITSTWNGIIMPNETATLLQTGGNLFDLGRITPYRLP